MSDERSQSKTPPGGDDTAAESKSAAAESEPANAKPKAKSAPAKSKSRSAAKKAESGSKKAEPGSKKTESGPKKARPAAKKARPGSKKTESGSKIASPAAKKARPAAKKAEPGSKKASPAAKKAEPGAKKSEPAATAGGAGAEAKGVEAARLPAYGLAADVLAAGEPEGRRGEDGDSEETGAFDVRISDPERIFSFADRLAARGEADAEPETPTRITTWVTFSLAGETFALPVEPVREVLRVTSITRVPHAPAPIRGVSNVRGRVIPVIDLRLRIGLEAADLDRSSRVVVVRSRGRLLGLLVDAVHQVVHLDLNRAQPPPDDVMTVQSDYISGVYHMQEQLVLMLDVERALVIHDQEELEERRGGGRASEEGAADHDSRHGAPGAA